MPCTFAPKKKQQQKRRRIHHYKARERKGRGRERGEKTKRKHAFRIVAQRICTMLYCGRMSQRVKYMYRLCIHEVRECFAAVFQPFCYLFCAIFFFFFFFVSCVSFVFLFLFFLILFSWNIYIHRNLDGDDDTDWLVGSVFGSFQTCLRQSFTRKALFFLCAFFTLSNCISLSFSFFSSFCIF